MGLCQIGACSNCFSSYLEKMHFKIKRRKHNRGIEIRGGERDTERDEDTERQVAEPKLLVPTGLY